MPALDIVLVPALSDNYVYLLHDAASGATAVVDPGEAAPVEAALAERGWKLTHILNTHHHADHIDGNETLKAKHGATLVGPTAETSRIPDMDVTLAEGDTYDFAGHTIQVFDTPGHTTGHISLYIADSDALFPGDTLFSLGCGRMFEGTPAQFWDSLSKLRKLPDATYIYCGHEYTASNAKFALSIDGGNDALKARAKEIEKLRANGEPTIPSLLGQEKAINPFLRADDPAIAAAVGKPGADPVEVFAAVRKGKDNF
ncbi:hydroxyacylglutathione hydrolase [Thalassobaculum sp.]|uniref:hydroxyacylglutathione hydrolase n=1 Tax=Thalassobaculum sp. TaxID=2022740 RepID=UPI003B5CCBDE